MGSFGAHVDRCLLQVYSSGWWSLGGRRLQRKSYMPALTALVLLTAPASAQSGDEAPVRQIVFVLSAERLNCLRTHASLYRTAARDPMFIPVGECPKAPSPFMMSMLVNSSNRPKGSVAGARNEASSFIYVTKAQFECLVSIKPKSAALYKFLPQTCKIEPMG